MSETISASKLADKIIEKRKLELAKKISSYPRRNLIMSDISECSRYLTHSVLDYEKKPLPSEDLIARFEVGNLMEREIIRDLEGLGFHIAMNQKPVELKAKDGGILASGRVDGFIDIDHIKFPFEIKSSAPYIYDQIKTLDDLQKKPWLKKYIYQIQLYLYANGLEQGLMIFTNCLGGWKIMPVYLDYGLCEWILQKIERAYELIKKKEYGERIPYDNQMCGKCSFSHICLPDVINRPADVIENEALENDISRHEELKPLASEYDKIHDHLKETFKGIEKATVGTRFLVMNVPSNRTTYDLPEEVESQIDELKKAHAKKVPVTRLVIEDLDKKTTQGE